MELTHAYGQLLIEPFWTEHPWPGTPSALEADPGAMQTGFLESVVCLVHADVWFCSS